ncbi:MAG: oxidoreductase [Phycisphaerales bacterium]|nr:oxidoreductase [Phycisphaerales bacterium]
MADTRSPLPASPSPVTRPTIVSPDTLRAGGDRAARTPPGQTLTAKWPVLHYGNVPKVDPHAESWELRVFGAACDAPYELSYAELKALPTVDVKCDMHCVTHWSRLDNVFTGVPTKLLVDRAKPRADARYVMCHGENGFTTNLPIAAFTGEDCVLAWAWDGKDLTPDHGYPLRGVVPQLYLWKSAKWIRAIEIRTADAPGFWEQNGYHMRGDPWKEERFGW